MTDFGVVTTPCVAFVTRMTGAAAGVKGGCARVRFDMRVRKGEGWRCEVVMWGLSP